MLVGLYMYRYEGSWGNQFFVYAATLLTAALTVLATRRILTAAILVPALVAIVVHAGAVKHQILQMNLHAYDVVFFLTSGPTLSFLWSEYRTLMAQLLAALTATIFATIIAYRIDATRVPRIYSSAAVCALAAATVLPRTTKASAATRSSIGTISRSRHSFRRCRTRRKRYGAGS